MIRGTTAQFKFKLPYSYEQLETITIKFWQDGNSNELLPIKKYKSNCSERVEGEIYVSLLPSQTAAFSDKYKAKMQLIAKPYENIGAPFGSKEHLITVYPMPDDIVVEDPTIDPVVPTEDGWIELDGGEII